MYLKILKLLLISSLLVGCSKEVKKIEVKSAIKINCGEAIIDKVILNRIQWQIITDMNGRNWIAIDGKNYSMLGINMQSILKGVKQLQAVNTKLTTCINDHNRVLDDANTVK